MQCKFAGLLHMQSGAFIMSYTFVRVASVLLNEVQHIIERRHQHNTPNDKVLRQTQSQTSNSRCAFANKI
jgi:hypothetical protein